MFSDAAGAPRHKRPAAPRCCPLSMLPLFLGLVALLAGCAMQEAAPVAPVAAQSAELRAIPEADFQSLRLLAGPQPAAKRATASRLIRARSGGRVRAEWEIEGDDDEIEIEVQVRVRPRALERDTRISVALASSNGLDLILGEHGTQFSTPAELTIEVEGIELPDGVDAENVNLYWLDEDAGLWYPVPRARLRVDDDEIEGKWLLDHFSRYSLSGGGPG